MGRASSFIAERTRCGSLALTLRRWAAGGTLEAVWDGEAWWLEQSAQVVSRSAFEETTRAAVVALGEIALQAPGYAGKNTDCMCVYELQDNKAQGRPVYRRQGKEEWLYFGSNGQWIVGSTKRAAGGL